MRKSVIISALILLGYSLHAQRVHIGVFGGLSAYNGDLTEKIFPKKVTNGAIGITGNYELTDNITLRAGFTYSVVGGADRYNKDTVLQARNLSFETSVAEFSLLGEFYFLNLNYSRFSPYIYGGVGVFHFNPYAIDAGGNKIFLQPLGTEGQGIAGYPGKPYHRTQVCLPFGGGVKFAITDNLRVAVEGGLRKLFTDYLDDVSGNYAAESDLLAARGQQAVDISYRGDEVPGGSAVYPAKGAQRGSPKSKDYYYFSGIHLTYRLGGGDGHASRKSKMGCPVF